VAKKFAALCATILVLLMVMTANVLAADGNSEALTISGDGVSQEVTFTRAEIEAMTRGISQHIYSVTNNFPADKVMYRKGVALSYLLDQAGVKDTASQAKFISSDGYNRTFTYQELFEDRYYFPAQGSQVKVPVIIALYNSSEGFNSMSSIELALTMGQRVKGEQTNPWFVKYLQTIEVSTMPPEQWPPVTFARSEGPDGTTVQLKHSNYDLIKIYYTTDGTDPTINSPVYNVSASYYQPQLNKPIAVEKDTEIRAMAVGAGKTDSAVASTAVASGGIAFSDLDGYPWARPAIEDLSGKGIISGMGDSRFAPGEPLTRAQFAVMMILALGEQPDTAAANRFSDVNRTDWHFPYVQKAAALGILHGYTDGTFRPDQVLNRQEMLTIAVQAMGVKVDSAGVPADLLTPFAAETRISDWARAYIAHAEALGILEHGHMVMDTGQGLAFDAKAQTIRAEAAETVYRMLTNKTAGK
jgi:hypothetical protein